MDPCSTSLTPDSFWGEKDDLSSAWRSCRWLCAPVCPAPCTGRRPVSCQKAAGPPLSAGCSKVLPGLKREESWPGEAIYPEQLRIQGLIQCPLKLMERLQRAVGARGSVPPPPRAAHPRGSGMHPHSEKARGCSSHLCPSLGARPLGQGCPFLLERAPPGPVPT